MPNFILRNTPPFWPDFIAKAKRDGWPLGALVKQLARDYIDGKIAPSTKPPIEHQVAVIPWTCGHCRRSFEIHVKHTPGFSISSHRLVECPYCEGSNHPLLPGDIEDIVKLPPA
jgi:DNA-directed RNA polymerase subunit RPC12/RpoP